MLALQVVAKVGGALTLDATRAPTAEDDLPTPHRTRAALSEHVVFGAKQQMCDQLAADAVVPRARVFWKRLAPGVANAFAVVCVIHVQASELGAALLHCDLCKVDADVGKGDRRCCHSSPGCRTLG